MRLMDKDCVGDVDGVCEIGDDDDDDDGGGDDDGEDDDVGKTVQKMYVEDVVM